MEQPFHAYSPVNVRPSLNELAISRQAASIRLQHPPQTLHIEHVAFEASLLLAVDVLSAAKHFRSLSCVL